MPQKSVNFTDHCRTKENNGILYEVASELRLPFEISEGKVVPDCEAIKEKFSLTVEEKYLKQFKDFLEKRNINFKLSRDE